MRRLQHSRNHFALSSLLQKLLNAARRIQAEDKKTQNPTEPKQQHLNTGDTVEDSTSTQNSRQEPNNATSNMSKNQGYTAGFNQNIRLRTLPVPSACSESDSEPKDDPFVTDPPAVYFRPSGAESDVAFHHGATEKPSRYRPPSVPPSEASSTQRKNVLFRLQVATWVWLTILGQLVVLSVAILFFMLIHFSSTPMHQALAETAIQSPRAVALCVTMTATLFSIMATFFFSKSLVLYLTSVTCKPTSLPGFLTVSNLSRGAVVISMDNLNWTSVSILTLVLLHSLTASFTSIFTPTPLIMRVPIGGTEFALDSQHYAQAATDPQISNALPTFGPAQLSLENQVTAVIGPLALTSAYASASSRLGYPQATSYLGTLFNSTTGGILPTIPSEKDALDAARGVERLKNFDGVMSEFQFNHHGFKASKVLPFNYTIIQQGFTVDVKCTLNAPNPAANQPSLTTKLQENITLPDQRVAGFWNYYVQCPNKPATNHTMLLRPRGSMLLSQNCSDMDILGNPIPGAYLLILGGYGPMYSFITPRTCQFTPYFTLVEVEYSRKVNVNRVISREAVTAATSAVSRLVYSAMFDTMQEYAVDARNKVGDDISSLYGITSDLKVQNDDLLNSILESYFKGIIEIKATLLKTPPISVGQKRLVADSFKNISSNWTHTFNGTWLYETLGWHSDQNGSKISIVGILPILIITLSSISLSVFSWISLKRSQYHTQEPFDPNNLVTLLKAGQDGSVAESLRTTGQGSSISKLKIQLQRHSTQWQLRPVA
ncbi:hypothetical protein O181_031090 [Austropuccinia psidii MF-1]|uniref:Uncharacterized protein n=1 Tax=Austropuccinia psidii MF-1 TaxID=1389203 RepID=A0A9Q3CYD4_9BASI|nr:hypothetical protein [Austropuccinia psidii MF-1]